MKERKMVYAPITREDVAWVATAYSHLVGPDETITGKEFARRIRQTYDCERSVKNNLAAIYAEFGLEKIDHRAKRNKITWWPDKEVRLRSNARVFNEWKEGEAT